jgi:hypothetical protein
VGLQGLHKFLLVRLGHVSADLGFFRLIETKGRTFEELDVMFSAEVTTKKFASYHIDAYADDIAIKAWVLDGKIMK